MPLRNLLVPTDFSDQALHSLQYALGLAKEVGATLHLLHSYFVPMNTIETDYVADQALWLEQARQRAQEEMRLLEQRHMEASGVLYECHTHPGPRLEDINQTIREKSIDLLVMGTYKSDQLESFFGELYTHAIRKAKAPVLLVPEGFSYTSPTKALFATDLKPLDSQEPLLNLRHILTSLNPELILLHVEKRGDRTGQKRKQELERLKEHFALFRTSVVLQEADDVEEGILSYGQLHKDGWLVAVSHQYGLLEGLFHSSHTKKLARQTPVPLLVSHE